MTFSVKHLLMVTFIAVVGLTALANADKPLAKVIVNLLTLGVLILLAYGVWIGDRETRAFRIGFLAWVALFCWAIEWPFDIGTNQLLDFASDVHRPRSPSDGKWISSYYSIGRCLLSLLVGLIGGWVTVYFYRKRQRMLSRSS